MTFLPPHSYGYLASVELHCLYTPLLLQRVISSWVEISTLPGFRTKHSFIEWDYECFTSLTNANFIRLCLVYNNLKIPAVGAWYFRGLSIWLFIPLLPSPKWMPCFLPRKLLHVKCGILQHNPICICSEVSPIEFDGASQESGCRIAALGSLDILWCCPWSA